MKKIIYSFLLLVSLTVLAIPPWNIAWKAQDASVENESLKPDRFAGWHDWSFLSQEHNQTMAWDGINSGGKIGYQGTPSIAADIFLGEILVLILCFLGLHITTRKKKHLP